MELGDALSLLFALVYSFLVVATWDLCEEGEPSGNVLLSISDGRRIFPYHNADSGGNAAGVSRLSVWVRWHI